MITATREYCSTGEMTSSDTNRAERSRVPRFPLFEREGKKGRFMEKEEHTWEAGIGTNSTYTSYF